MDVLKDVLLGFQASLQPINLLFCFIGVLIGTLVGVLPGIGPIGAVSILLPATFHAPPLASIIMLAGIYYGAMYGGSTTSILVNIPGETASIVTCMDGHQMALQGRAGPALGISAFGSFIAGTLCLMGLTVLVRPLAGLALKFGPPEYFGLMILGLIILIYLTQKSLMKAIIMGGLGIIISSVGLDIVSGQIRFTYNSDELLQGVGVIPIIIGFYGIAEGLKNLEKIIERSVFETHIKGLFPNLKDWADSIWPIIRGTIMGFFLGILPGGGAVLPSFLSYGLEKRLSKRPERFGKGAIEGVAGPEAANNAGSTSAFIPLMTLGIPSNVIMAMLFAGLLVHNITPGPLLLKDHPDVFWGVICSMYIGNAMLLVLNLPLIGMWVQVTKIPFRLLFPMIILICTIGVYSVNNSIFDLWLMLIFGVIGYIMKKCDYEFPPFVLAYVLTPLLEQSLRQSLIISGGSFAIFLFRPIPCVSLTLGALLLISASITGWKKKRQMLLEG
ncbi:MAG: tripartite tricarboxylate transporter permease [Pseudomonadota bacterium]